ncbi:MAG TPA: 1,4-alpha-glucan branching protein GlgB [Phycisphaerae bacterium]|nr:1,4-alpha-glucan branching protein GlgB [Phycisphaerae bacterium]
MTARQRGAARRPAPAPRRSPLAPGRDDLAALLAIEHGNPHGVLGAHPLEIEGHSGVVIRALHPDAEAVEIILADDGQVVPCERTAPGLFSAFVPGARLPLRYRQRFRLPDGRTWERDDPYRFLPTVGEQDLYLFNEGTHRRLWEVLGAHERTVDGVQGVSFSVWAPNARRVSVVGDFCQWDGRLLPMRGLGNSGVYELFVPGVHPGAHYKYEIKTQDGHLRLKADPMGAAMEIPPGTASRVYVSSFDWSDADWMRQREQRDALRSPLAIYEVHLGSWARVPEEGCRVLTYREAAPKLVEHVKRLGFNYVELLPIAEHPFGGSWGYQVSGYYAPTARFGAPDDFRYFVDYCHRHGVGVIIDWVPAHFPRDDFALARFDGSALYEHSDPRLGEHPDWGTLIFNYGRHEVRNFLIANALYWLREFHVDGLRVDAVASMLYLDYSRKPGEWVPNKYGGNENLEAIDFLRTLNETVRGECPGALMIAEESTAYAGVSRPVSEGGLGFTFKWNMGWMHDTLLYLSKEPIHRKYHHWQLSFAMVYEYHERFIMPISHDEVVHGKRALLEKMPGDLWRKFANLRLLLAYQFTRPGKKLQFMGFELAPWYEWHYDTSLDWRLAEDHWRQGLWAFMADLGRIYHENSPFWRFDHEPQGFNWISYDDAENSVVAYARRDGQNTIVVVLNFTPVPRNGYRIGVPQPGEYVEWLSSDDDRYAGSDFPTVKSARTEPVPWHWYEQSIVLDLPPLAAVILAPTTYA